MKNSDDDSLSDIEQYYGFDLKSLKLHRRQHRATWKKLIIYIGFFLAVATIGIILGLKNNYFRFNQIISIRINPILLQN